MWRHLGSCMQFSNSPGFDDCNSYFLELSCCHAWCAPPFTLLQLGGGRSGIIFIGTATALNLRNALGSFLVDDACLREDLVVVRSTFHLTRHAIAARIIAKLQLRERPERAKPLATAQMSGARTGPTWD